ncbi:putative quinol monooxygenase [Microbacterium enclense]|uniref:putative quinol monooxygenase n=1 Tax=Microbacterium enclense TaxID=993073 RepID=UPI00344A03F6
MTGKYLYAQFTAEEGAGDTVAALLRGYGEAVSAEPGNVRFDAHRLADDPRSFFVYEEYVDDAAFQAHLGTEHCAVFNRAFAPHVVGGASTLTWLNPVS